MVLNSSLNPGYVHLYSYSTYSWFLLIPSGVTLPIKLSLRVSVRAPHTRLKSVKKKQGLWSVTFVYLFIYHLFSISCRMNGEYLWCFKRESKWRERQDLTEEQNRIGIFLSKHGESEEKCKEILLRGLVGLFQEQFFVARKGCIKGCSKIFIFPAKKLRKIRCSKIRMRRFFFFIL